MGVMGAGKTTLARALSEALSLPFIDADDYHPAANRAKMATGEPLNDADRAPWLSALGDALMVQSAGAVLACSALKRSYREALEAAAGPLHWIWLDAPPEKIAARLVERTGHFANPGLLRSQFETLEAPEGALRLDAIDSLAHNLARARTYLKDVN